MLLYYNLYMNNFDPRAAARRDGRSSDSQSSRLKKSSLCIYVLLLRLYCNLFITKLFFFVILLASGDTATRLMTHGEDAVSVVDTYIYATMPP